MTITDQQQQPSFPHLLPTLCSSMAYPHQKLPTGVSANGYTIDYISKADMPLLLAWQDYLPGSPAAAMEVADGYIAVSSFAQSFILRYLDFPLLRIDVSDAFLLLDLNAHYLTAEGDFSLNLVMPRYKHPALKLLQQGLHICLDYFQSYPEVKRLVADFSKQDVLAREVLSQTGFSPYPLGEGRYSNELYLRMH